MKRLSFVLTFLILLFCVSAWGTDYYVDPDSAGGGDGTTTAITGPQCAFKTIAEAISGVPAGQHVVFFKRGGVWKERLDVKSGIEYNAYGFGDLPVIDGESTRSHCVLGNDDDNITFKNIKFINATTYLVRNVRGNMWEFEGCVFENTNEWDGQATGYLCIADDGNDYHGLIIDNCIFADICGWNNICIRSNDPDSMWYDITITNNVISQSIRHVYQSNDDCVGAGDPYDCCTGPGTGTCLEKHVINGVYADVAQGARANGQVPYGWTIKNNIFSGLSGGAINICAGDTLSNAIIHNTIVDCANINQIELHYCKNLIVESNVISGTWESGQPSSTDGGGIILDWDSDDGETADMAWASDGVVVRRNVVRGRTLGSGGFGIKAYASKNCTIYNNLVYGNKEGLVFASNDACTGNVGYNNTCANNTSYGIYLYSRSGWGTLPEVVLKNNIIYGSQYGIRILSSTTPTISNNCYYNNSIHDRWDVTTSATFAAGPGAVSSDPKFVNSSSNNFHLSSTSPCRDGGILNAGDPYSEVVYDLDGRRVTQPDGTEYYLNSQPIGCYLYWPPDTSIGGMGMGMSMGAPGLPLAP